MADQGQIMNKENQDKSRDTRGKNDVRTDSTNLCRPYPFNKYHNTYRYIKDNILNIPESGPFDLIEPCHEFKSFTETPAETRMAKFILEVIPFGAACMNSRTNGTIHFGIGDEPNFTHGQVLGVVVEDKEAFTKELKYGIDTYFTNFKQDAHMCIRPPRFVEVLSRDTTTSNLYVIEVDVVPEFLICGEKFYQIFELRVQDNKAVKSKTKHIFVRDGGNTRKLLTSNSSGKNKKNNIEYDGFLKRVQQLSKRRKQAEEKHLAVIKSSTQGFRLSQMITGGSHTLDKSNYNRCVLVTNKSHPSQWKSLSFLPDLNPTSILDLDPESAEHGLQCLLSQRFTAYLPIHIKFKNTGKKQKVARNISWLVCNGSFGDEEPLDIDQGSTEEGACVQDLIPFLNRGELQTKRFLVVFLLLSTVDEAADPLVETYHEFVKDLDGTRQILSICDGVNAFTSWRNLVEARCGVDVSGSCVHELSLAEVNGTVLSLLSKNRRTGRFLTCGGGSKVLLRRKAERGLNTLDVLCVNQCEGGDVDKTEIEQNFYRGAEPSWWNCYFSELLVKRSRADHISDVILDVRSGSEMCVLFNLLHVPGCGGTTLAKSALWTLRDKVRCAVLKDNNADFEEVADQVVKLLLYDDEENVPRVPVLLMIDGFDAMEKVTDLQRHIKLKCRKNIKSVQVILLNCMRSETPEHMENMEHGIFIGQHLPIDEQRMFEKILVEKENKHEKVETFYRFMMLKASLKPEYIQSVVQQTLRSFNVTHKHSQLLAIVSLLNVYCKEASLSFCLCRTFLNLSPKPICVTDRIEDLFGRFSALLCISTANTEEKYRSVEMIHSNIAKICLQELKSTHKMTLADITNLLLTTPELYQQTEDKGKFIRDVYNMLVRRCSEEKASQGKLTSLIEEIEAETPELVESVLLNASKRFENCPRIAHLLSSYYSQTQDFKQAEEWKQMANKLKETQILYQCSPFKQTRIRQLSCESISNQSILRN